MPQGVPIQPIPSQTFTVTLDTNTFELTIKEAEGIMAASLVINGVDTIDNLRVAAGSPIIPSKYEEAGNFMILTANFELPYYTQFNITQQMIYFTADELAAFRVDPTFPIQPSYFNPLGQLPLRYKPQGYTLAA